jgi:hypothetical protein
MKKELFIALVLTVVVFSSCKKDDDFTNPDNLVGTEWKSLDTDYSDEEYYLFKFNSKTIVEEWTKNSDETKLYNEMSGTYTISGNKITIDFGYTPLEGVIEGKTMNFAYDGGVVAFTKQ